MLITDRLPITIKLALMSFSISLMISIPLGILAAMRPNSWIDLGFDGLFADRRLLAGLLYLDPADPGVFLQVERAAGARPGRRRLDTLKHSDHAVDRARFLAGRDLNPHHPLLHDRGADPGLHRNRAFEGLHGPQIVLKHAFRNALIPVITVAGLQFGYLLVGTVLVDYTFGLGGLGALLIDSVQRRDYPVVPGHHDFHRGALHPDQSGRRCAVRRHRSARALRRSRLTMVAEIAPIRIDSSQETPSSWSMFFWRLRGNPKAMIGLTIVILLLILIVFAPLLAPHDPNHGELSDTLASPGQHYLLGADKNGRDVLSRLIFGTRTALGGALAVVLISELIGVPLGIWAALSRRLDRRGRDPGLDMMLAFPPLAAFVCSGRRIRTVDPQRGSVARHSLCAVHHARGPQRDAGAEGDGLHRGGESDGLSAGAHHLPPYLPELRLVR